MRCSRCQLLDQSLKTKSLAIQANFTKAILRVWTQVAVPPSLSDKMCRRYGWALYHRAVPAYVSIGTFRWPMSSKVCDSFSADVDSGTEPPLQ